jgi:DNA-binding CsgD family transcriptional regulator
MHRTSPFVARRHQHLLARLQQEWLRLDRSPTLLRQARSWHLPVPSFSSLDELVRHCGFGAEGRGRHDDDEVLAALVVLARTDDLAARVLLQRLLPAFAAITRSTRGYSRQQDSMHELLAAAWQVIRTFPIERRPTYVAASLVRSVVYQAFVRPSRRADRMDWQPWWVFDLTPAEQLDTASAADELDELLRMAEDAGLAPADLELARRLGRGEHTATLAAEQRVSERTIRNRRAEVAHRLRAVALAAS